MMTKRWIFFGTQR